MEYVVLNITNRLLKKEIIAENQKVKFEYGLTLMLELILDLIGFLIISVIFNCVFLMVAFLVTFALVRANAGGYHAKTALRCFITISLLSLLSIWFVNNINISTFVYLVILIFSSALIVFLSPVESAEKPLSIEMNRKCKFRTFTILIILNVFIIILTVIANKGYNWINIIILAVFWQSILMLPILNKA